MQRLRGFVARVVFGRKGQQFRRSVGPEAPALGEAGHGGIGPAGEHQSAGAFKDGFAGGVAEDRAISALGAQEILLAQKLIRESILLVIRAVVPLAQPQAHRIEPGPFPDQAKHLADQRVQIAIAPVEHAQHFRRQVLIQFGLLALGDVHVDASHAGGPAAVVVPGPSPIEDPAHGAVRTDDSVFHVELAALIAGRVQFADRVLAIIRMQGIAPGLEGDRRSHR